MQSHVKKNKLEDRPITNVELRMVQARLRAIMSGIDGKVLEVENLVAESMLELLDKKEAYELKTLYKEELEKPQTDETLQEVISFMQRAPIHERVSILKMLSSLAICDGEVHENEEAFLKSAMRKLKVIVQISDPNSIRM